MILTSFATDILTSANWTTRVRRETVNQELSFKLSRMREDGAISSALWCSYDAIFYGIGTYIKTGRATVEIENKINSLSGHQLIKLIIKMYLDGCNTSGETWDWLRKWGDSTEQMIKG